MEFGMFDGMFGSMRDEIERAADSAVASAEELEAVRRELEQTRDELANYKAEQAVQREADSRQADLNAKKAFCHDYRVAAFSIVITLLIEHLPEIVDFLCFLFKRVVSLFH